MAKVNLPIHWKQGEHIAIVGRTGSGKTYLVSKLTQLRQYVVILRTKPDKNKFPNFVTVRHASAMQHWRSERILLEPEYRYQALEGYRMLEQSWQDGGWTVVIDENWYAEQIGLKPYIIRGLTQGRSKDISMMVGMQRPVDISRFALSEITHLFVFRCEGRDLKFSLRDSTVDEIVPAVRNLKGHNFVYYNAAKEIITTGNANALDRVIISTYRPQTLDTMNAGSQSSM